MFTTKQKCSLLQIYLQNTTHLLYFEAQLIDCSVHRLCFDHKHLFSFAHFRLGYGLCRKPAFQSLFTVEDKTGGLLIPFDKAVSRSAVKHLFLKLDSVDCRCFLILLHSGAARFSFVPDGQFALFWKQCGAHPCLIYIFACNGLNFSEQQ